MSRAAPYMIALRAADVAVFLAIAIGVTGLLVVAGADRIALPTGVGPSQPTTVWTYAPLFSAAAVPLVLGDRWDGFAPETVRRRGVRVGAAITCTLATVALYAVLGGVSDMPGQWWGAARNFVSWTGLALVGAAFCGSRLGWILPIALLLPLQWIAQPDPNSGAAAFVFGAPDTVTWLTAVALLIGAFLLALATPGPLLHLAARRLTRRSRPR